MDFLAFDTPAHTAAQAKCIHVVNHAIDAETRRVVQEAIDNARRTDMSGFDIAMLQLTGECEHRVAPNNLFKAHITLFEDEEIYQDGEDAMERLLQLVNGAAEAGYFKPLGLDVMLYVQTIDGGPCPLLTIALLPTVEIIVPGLDIDDLVDTEHIGIEQALAILRTTYGLVEQTLKNHREHFAPVGA